MRGRKATGRLPLTFWKAIGYISASVTLLVLAFQLGQYLGSRNAKRDEFGAFVTYIVSIKEGVAITGISSDQETLYPGGTCQISVTVQNRNSFESDLWVGASIIAADRTQYWNAREDRVVRITGSGFTTIKRSLTIPETTPPGTYDLSVNLWFGMVADPSHSERISSALLKDQITVIPAVSR